MNETILLGEYSHASCQLCQREIPRAEVLTIEAQEYAYYFCGQGCYQQWQWEQDTDPKSYQLTLDGMALVVPLDRY